MTLLGFETVWPAEQKANLANIRLVQKQHQYAGQAHSKATVTWCTEAEEVQVEAQALGLESLLLCLLGENFDAVFALCSGSDFGTPPN